MSDTILKSGGIIYGAAYDNNFNLKHIRADNIEKRNQCRDSKYHQSNILDSFKMIENDLKNRKYVFVWLYLMSM